MHPIVVPRWCSHTKCCRTLEYCIRSLSFGTLSLTHTCCCSREYSSQVPFLSSLRPAQPDQLHTQAMEWDDRRRGMVEKKNNRENPSNHKNNTTHHCQDLSSVVRHFSSRVHSHKTTHHWRHITILSGSRNASPLILTVPVLQFCDWTHTQSGDTFLSFVLTAPAIGFLTPALRYENTFAHP